MTENSCLKIRWIDGAYKGEIDFLPLEWFANGGDDLQHETLCWDGSIIKARCAVTVLGKAAIVDYCGKYAAFNEEQGCELGRFRIIFADQKRKDAVDVLWADEDGDFQSGLVIVDDADDEEFSEGGIRMVAHRKRERDPKLRQRKIDHVMAEKHKLSCEACTFDFAEFYGEEWGKGFCEVHHIKSLGATGPTKTTINDLSVLCSNCHRMIHKTDLSVLEFAEKIALRRDASKPKFVE